MPLINPTPFKMAVFGSRAIAAVGVCFAATRGVDCSRMRDDGKAFLTECVASGLSAAVPTVLMCYNRRDRTKSFSFTKSATPVLASFMMFFVLNVILEVAGINAEGAISDAWTDVAMGAYAALMIALAWKSSKVGLFDDFKSTLDELALFSASSAVSTYIITTNRGVPKSRVVRKTLVSAGVNAMMYTAMRLGGSFDMLGR